MSDIQINHIAIIPDGNRRWAKQKGLATFLGHKEGGKITSGLVRHLWDKGVHTITLWGLSTDNQEKRSPEERAFLYEVIESSLRDSLDEAIEKGTKIVHLGRKDRIPQHLLDSLTIAEEKTKNGTNGVLNLAVDYGGRDEMIRAIKKAGDSKTALTETNLGDFLDTAGQKFPNPDLVIRTSGEERTSGFLTWQSALSELYFEKVHFPDLTPAILDRIIADVKERERRLGK